MFDLTILKTLAGSYVPPPLRPAPRTGGTSSARYCYSVWLRHLCRLSDAGLPTQFRAMAEIGPGDSIGIGLAALLSGTEKYYGLDVLDYNIRDRSLMIFDEILQLYRSRADIPDQTEFPLVNPVLPSYRFPSHILDEARSSRNLADERIGGLRKKLLSLQLGYHPENPISYVVPYDAGRVIGDGSLDIVMSQAALQAVPDLDGAYRQMHRWLAPKGVMSHRIPCDSQGTTSAWNGHWAISDFSWRLIVGKRAYLTNREPLSSHTRALQQSGFEIVDVLPTIRGDGIARHKLAARFRRLSDADVRTSGAHLLARRV
jgi:hypothetical protein